MKFTHLPAIFIADDRGLDFLNSIATPVDAVVDWIADGESLLRWLDQSGLVAAHTLNTVRSLALPGELDAVAAQARALREWFRGFVMHHIGKPLGKRAIAELAPLNQILSRDEQFQQIHAEDGALVLGSQRRWRSAESLLLPIAQALADTVCQPDFNFAKHCEGPACTLLFLDKTNRRARRWCSMAVCGNRAKQAAHRARLANG
jgi:predicted RNA-binding Zn ribbon-like protein